jgi:hypothetical protein
MPAKIVPKFHCTKPCSSCPYRTSSPLQLWDKQEFIDLLENDFSLLGKVYGCHKKNGSVCIGFLMDQDNRGFPSIALRLELSRHEVSREYLDKLKSPSPLYKSIEEMIKVNYPEILNN